jgi:hypothetical protein
MERNTGQPAWHEQRHKLAPNSGRSRRGLNPPPMATKCGQAG